MKKTVSLLLVVVLACVFAGCSSGKDYSEKAIKSAESVIDNTEQYLNGTLSLMMTDLYVWQEIEDLESVIDTTSVTYKGDYELYREIIELTELFILENDSGDYTEDISKQIEVLRDTIGYKQK